MIYMRQHRRAGGLAVHLHCPWSFVLISDSFCVQRRDEEIQQDAWSLVCWIIAGGNYVAAGSQRQAQGEIGNFDL
jgi:hypothetical protein